MNVCRKRQRADLCFENNYENKKLLVSASSGEIRLYRICTLIKTSYQTVMCRRVQFSGVHYITHLDNENIV